MRRIQQPGPVPADRALVVPVRAVPIEAELPAGASLLDALHDIVRAHGAESACLTLSGGALGPFGYVMPALSPDEAHAAWYSAPRHPAGPTLWEKGCVTVGMRDGENFFHCHGFWTEADGKRSGGHVLPEATVIAAPIRAEGVGIIGARFTAQQDSETGFRLFQPVATEAVAGADALAVRLRPNQDITLALEGLGRAAGFRNARVAGGVGSTIGARFSDAGAVEPFATELFITDAALDCRNGAASRLATALVDLTGGLAQGSLVRGDNPVLMTVELVLLPA